MPSVLFYVQHLLGIGHLARASLIAEAMQSTGLDVTLVLGGAPVAGFPAPPLKTLALPPVRAADERFSALADLDGRPVSERYLEHRRDQLLGAFTRLQPGVLLIEAYPFGRRQMRFELDPLLELAKAAPWSPLIAASVRDILQEGRKPGRDAETVALLRSFFDLVLVHGDPALVPFEATFPQAPAIEHLIRYTGLVAGPAGELAGPGFDVVVSAGGGAAGAALMRAARAALAGSSLRHERWCFLTGPNFPPRLAADLFTDLPANAAVTAIRGDFRALLKAAKLSISQAGYNTTADVLTAGCRAIMVPFAAGMETEQTRRAAALAERRLVHVLSEAELSAGTLVRLIDVAVREGKAPPSTLDLGGARRSAELLLKALHARSPD